MIFWQESVGKPTDRRLETAGARCAVSSWLVVCAACAHFSSIRALIIQEIDPGTWRNSDASVRLKAFTRPAVSISSMRRCPRLEIVCRPRPAPILARVSGTSAALPLSISQSLYLSSSLLSALCSLLSVSLSLSLPVSLRSLLSALCSLFVCTLCLSLCLSHALSFLLCCPALLPAFPLISRSHSLSPSLSLSLLLSIFSLALLSIYLARFIYLSSQIQLDGLNHHLDVTDEVPWEGRDAAFDDECRREKKDGVHSIVWPRAQKVRGFWTVACAPKVSL